MRTLADVPKALELDGQKFEFRKGKLGFPVKVKASEAEKNFVEKPASAATPGAAAAPGAVQVFNAQGLLVPAPSPLLMQRSPLSAPLARAGSRPLISPLMEGGVVQK